MDGLSAMLPTIQLGMRVGMFSTCMRNYQRMASVVTSPSTDTTIVVPPKPLHAAPESSASVVVHELPARDQIRMGRAATVPAGVNWITLSVIIFFYAGALAAFFFFSWS